MIQTPSENNEDSLEEMIEEEFNDDEEKVLRSIKMNRIIIPIIAGLGVVAYMLYNNWDAEEFAKLRWNAHTFFWIGLAIFLMVFRHMAYAFRLRILSDKFFSWRKCIQLIFIWEFSSAVSPTSVGGSAVALFVLAQEKLGAAKTAALVIYTIVVDTVFFLTAIPMMLLIFGGDIVPKLNDLAFGEWTFYVTFVLMATYGAFFFYGLFFNPKNFKSILVGFTKISFLKRFRKKAEDLGDDIILASKEIAQRKWTFHIQAYLSTFLAWSTRFFLLNCLIIAFNNPGVISLDFITQTELYARLQSLFVILLLLPSPGGAGFAEVVFKEFLVNFNYISEGVSVLVALIWRLISYYPYLIAGAIIIPYWLRNRINERRIEKTKSIN